MTDDKGVGGKYIAIPMYGFDYVHAPYDDSDNSPVHLFTGRDELINRLVSLLESKRRRGSYLIAGYRGVGKTSVVNRSIERFSNPKNSRSRSNSRKMLLPEPPIVIRINLGDNSSLTPLDIYFSIASFLSNQYLKGDGESVKKDIDVLIVRMGHEISETKGHGFGGNGGVEIDFKAVKANVGGSGEKNWNSNMRRLPISPREAEEQILDILKRVNKNRKVIFIFDEIDKLSNAEEFFGVDCQERNPSLSLQDKHARINTLLGSLKNFITTAEATFFFISGRETLDRYYSETGSPNSLYQSLFDSVFEVPSLLTDERYYSSRAWRMALLIEEYLCRRLIPSSGKAEVERENYTLKKHHSNFIKENSDCHSDGRLLVSTLRNFVYYLTFHSWGNPKRLASILESFIVPWSSLSNRRDDIRIIGKDPGRSEDCFWLFFDVNQLRAFSLAAELVSIFEHQFSREITKISDKLTVTSLASIQFILKHHSNGFTRESLRRMSEAMNVHRSPALNAIVDDLLTQTFKPYIRRVRNGLYRYRFHSGFEQELRYISHISELESAAYNFSLDAMRHVKFFFEAGLKKEIDEQGRAAVWSAHVTLGDICALEQSYNEASMHYSSAIRILKGKVGQSERDSDMEFLMQYVEVMVKNGDLEEHRQNYHHAAAIYTEAERAVEAVIKKNSVMRSKLLMGDSKWDMLKQPYWAARYLSMKRSPSAKRCNASRPDWLYKTSDLRFDLRAATLAFFSGNMEAAEKHYATISKNVPSDELPCERSAYVVANGLVGGAETKLVRIAHRLAKNQYASDKKRKQTDPDGPLHPGFHDELITILKRQFVEEDGRSRPSDITGDLWRAACILEESHIYISAAIVHMKIIAYLSTMLDAFGKNNVVRLDGVPEKCNEQVQKSGEAAFRCINCARQLESTQPGKTLLSRDFDTSAQCDRGNLGIPWLFDALLGVGGELTELPLEEQVYWQQSFWAHKLAAILTWARFTFYKMNRDETGGNDTGKEYIHLILPSDFSTLSVRPTIIMRWLYARDMRQRCHVGFFGRQGDELSKDGLSHANLLALIGRDPDDKYERHMTQLKACAPLMNAYNGCESLYFSLTAIRVISRRNMDLIIPRTSQIYFVQWEILLNLLQALLKKERCHSGAMMDELRSVREISFFLQRTLIRINKMVGSHERIPPTHFDYESIYLKLCESLDRAASLTDPTNRARTGIFQNKHYCHDDYSDADFSMDYTLAYMNTPSALFLREKVQRDHEQFKNELSRSQ